jgi:hypothetical protein
MTDFNGKKFSHILNAKSGIIATDLSGGLRQKIIVIMELFLYQVRASPDTLPGLKVHRIEASLLLVQSAAQ